MIVLYALGVYVILRIILAFFKAARDVDDDS